MIVAAGDNVTVDETQGDAQVTYTVSAQVPVQKPVKVDPDLMYGDGVETPLGVYEYDGETAGLVPDAPVEPENKFLRADGKWATITTPEDEQSDWLEQDTNAPSYIKNKPELASVATSGSYEDLTDKPVIPAAQAQSDWNEQDSSSVSYIKNKPDIDAMVAAATTEVRPGTNVNVSETVGVDGHKIYTVSASGGSGTSVQSDWNQTNPVEPDYIKNKPEIPAAQVNADWDANSGVAEILHKPGVFTGATSSSNGTPGFVPAPTTSDVDKVLCGDGTWKDYSNSRACTVAEMDGWLDAVDQENDSVEEGESEGETEGEDNGR